MAAPNNKFSEEQMDILRKNPYVRTVFECRVHFTVEFKELFWEMYTKENMLPYEILKKLGIDYGILGERRVWGISQNLKKEYQRYGGFSGRQKSSFSDKPQASTLKQEVKELRSEVEFLRKELERLDKAITER